MTTETLITFSQWSAGFCVLIASLRTITVIRKNLNVINVANRVGMNQDTALAAAGARYGWVEVVGVIALFWLVASWLT